MNTKRGMDSAEFRQEALRLLDSSGRRVVEIEHELGITAGLLYKWQRRYGEPSCSENGTGTPNSRELEAEIRRLKRENAIVQEEREILKKAVKRFSQEQR